MCVACNMKVEKSVIVQNSNLGQLLSLQTSGLAVQTDIKALLLKDSATELSHK